jgi:predicted glycoside hydrolase/deacetylase ChbG (UPF0249 family)
VSRRATARPPILIITADDLGLSAAYDRGIVEAAAAGAIDAAGAMVRRQPRPQDLGALAQLGVATGLHLEAERGLLDRGSILRQLEEFERLAGRPPDYLDGHHHCHAVAEIAEEVAAIAAGLDLPVRSISAEHRGLLRAAGVRTPDLLIGRYDEQEVVLPPELSQPPRGVRSIEWMVHPGHPDASSRSGYDRGRGEDLRVLLGFEPPPGLRRGGHRDLPRVPVEGAGL